MGFFSSLATIQDIENQKVKIKSIDVKDLLYQFDLDAIGKSTIKYYQAIIDLSEKIFDHLQKFEASQADTFKDLAKISNQLGTKYSRNPNLTDEENSMLESQFNFFM